MTEARAPRKERMRQRWRPLAAAAAAVAMAIVSVPPSTAAAAPAPNAAPNPTSTAGPAASGASEDPEVKATRAEAAAEARRTGHRIEVGSARTEYTQVFANPSGTFTVEQAFQPQRVKVDGKWTAIDPTLRFAPDGSVRPVATPLGMTFSGGRPGQALAELNRQGRALAFSWDVPLPVPTLSGPVATYPDVLPGVDLVVTAQAEEFSEVLVVKTAEAARNPKLGKLTFTTKGTGVSVRTETDGTLRATDPAGKEFFTGSQPLMWDSRADAEAKPPAAPEAAPAAPGAETPDAPSDAPRRTRPMAATLSGTGTGTGTGADAKLTITPDQSLLTAPDTVFPVVIDPTFPGRLQNWTTAYKTTPNTGYWNGAGFNEGDGNSYTTVARVGHETDTNGTARSFFELDTTNLWDAGIIRSTFRLRATHSWSCTSKPITLYDTPKISPSTNWSNSGGWWGYPVSTAKTGAGGGASCPAGDVEWDTTGPARLAAGNHWYAWSLGLRADDESTAYSWTKFQASSAILSTEANYPPETPDWLSTDPGTSCDGSVVLGDAPAVRLRARGQDRDGGTVKLYFRLYPTGGPVKDAGMVAVSAGNVGTLEVRTQDLPTGDYSWDVVAFDDAAWSGWSPTCRFTIDRSRPSKPPTVTSGDYVPDPAKTGKARGTGTFALTANGVGDVARYEYWTEWAPDHRPVDAPCAGCDRSISLRIPNPGPHTLSVRSKDRAGNYSDVATYDFWANGSGTVDAPGDLNGDGKVDVLTADPDGRLLFYPGNGNGGLGTPVRASQYTDTLPGNATAWKGNLVTSRGDWNGDGYADALVRRTDPTTGAVEVYLHPGLGDGRVCVDKECSGYQRMLVRDDANRARIAAATDLLAIDNATGDDTGLGLGYPDLLVLSGGQLWLYQGDGSATLDAAGRDPVLLGSGFAGTTLSTPGDLTGDGRPEVWARNATTGGITQYALTTAGTTLVLGPATTVAGTFTAAARPSLGSGGDLTGDGKPDLWARGADKHMYLYPGTGTGTGSGFGAAVPLTDSASLWGDCRAFSGLNVCGPILDKYLELGGPDGPLRNPVTGTTGTPDGIGRYVHFRSGAAEGSSAGSIYWSPDTGAHFVNGNIRNKWAELGWEKSFLGYPTSDELNIGGLGTSWISTFAGVPGQPGALPGAITFTGTAGTHELHGAIYQRYLALGGHNVIGFPTTDETPTPVKAGRYNHFVLPTGGTEPYLSIYWSPDTGAHEVHGDIRRRWSELGWENGYLGFPTSDEFTVAAGRRSSFTGGYIRWNGIAGGSTDYHGGDERPMARTNVAGDFNGDGRDDVATFIDYGTCAMGIWTFTTGPDGKPGNPVERKSWPGGWWCHGSAKYLAGDFDGDGRDDLAAVYGYGDGRVRIFTWLSRPDGSFEERLGRDVPPGNWDWNAIKPVTGDFNGDHRDDIAFLYDYGNCDSGLFTLFGQTSGGFATELASYRSGPGNWCAAASTLLAGDFDKDGRTDITAVYDYGNGNARLWTFRARPDGGFNGASVAWTGAQNDWWPGRAKYAAGDFNGDGYADIGAVYSYPDGRVRFFTFTGRSDGTVNGFAGGWDIPAGNWNWNALTLTGGKYDGDNRADLTFMYDFGDTRFSLAVVPGRPDGTFTGNLPGWETPPGLW